MGPQDRVVADSVIVALRRYEDFDADGGVRPTTWLFGILGNVIRNHARSERRRRARLERYRQMPRVEARARTEMALAGRLVDEFLATLDPDKRASTRPTPGSEPRARPSPATSATRGRPARPSPSSAELAPVAADSRPWPPPSATRRPGSPVRSSPGWARSWSPG